MINAIKSRGTQILIAITLLLCLWAIGTWIQRYMGDYQPALNWMAQHRGLLIALVGLNIGDILTTEIALRQSRGRGELNPIANSLFRKKFGKLELYLTKMALTLFILMLLAFDQDIHALLFVDAAFSIVLLNNIRSIILWWVSPEFSKITRSAPTSFPTYIIRVSEVFIIAGLCVYAIPHLI